MKDKIVNYIFEYAEQHLNYLILRNYENLPEDEGHDIDLLIPEKDYPAARRLIQELKEHFGISIFLHDDYFGLHSFCLIIGEAVLHLDFFTHIQWNRISFISTEQALSRKQRFKERYWVLSDADFEYYCWVNYLLAGGNVKEKYQKKALLWQMNCTPAESIDIRKGTPAKNRKMLVQRLCSSVSFARLCWLTLCTLCFKVYKMSRMDGRIYVGEPPLSHAVETCRFYCSCKQIDIADDEPLSLLQCFRLLYHERAVLISTAHWRKLRWHSLIPRIYTPDCNSSLEKLIENIYRGNRC